MKRTLLIFTICTITTAFAQQPSNTADTGIIINGVRWATRNVAAPGTFAGKPEDAGMFYQWNRKKVWNATDSIVTGWDNTPPAGDTWEKANDPSPSGWRVPTREEIQSLLDTAKVNGEWITYNEVNGYKFTDKTTGNSIFMPAAGYRDNNNSMRHNAGLYGVYWLSEMYGIGHACNLDFGSDGWGIYHSYRRYGFSVRCVAE